MGFDIVAALIIGFCLIVDIISFVKIQKFSFKGSILNFAFWLLMALLFCLHLNLHYSSVQAKEFLAGYTLERILSLDNIFVFYITFKLFNVSEEGQKKVIFGGILIAIILRILFIMLGSILLSKFSFIMYLLGLFLVCTGIKLLFQKESKKVKTEEGMLVKFLRKVFRITPDFHGNKFYIIDNKKILFTPLFLVMMLISILDIVFALDSIPAIFGITQNIFIVITANFFSLMGLRAMFYLITHLIEYCNYIKYSLAAILVFIGVKMLVGGFYHIPVIYSLLFIFISVGIAIMCSLFITNGNSNTRKF